MKKLANLVSDKIKLYTEMLSLNNEKLYFFYLDNIYRKFFPMSIQNCLRNPKIALRKPSGDAWHTNPGDF